MSKWQYDAEMSRNGIQILDILEKKSIDSSPIYKAIRHIDKSFIGHFLLQNMKQKNVSIILDKEIPSYGLTIPKDQTIDGNPAIIMNDNNNIWNKDLAKFIVSHAFFHIEQISFGTLRSFNTNGVKFHGNSQTLNHDQLCDETIASERMADLIAGCIIVEKDLKNKSILNSYKKIAPILIRAKEVMKNHDNQTRMKEIIKDAISLDNITRNEIVYYQQYDKRNKKPSLSNEFNFNSHGNATDYYIENLVRTATDIIHHSNLMKLTCR